MSQSGVTPEPYKHAESARRSDYMKLWKNHKTASSTNMKLSESVYMKRSRPVLGVAEFGH
jgi:hypothetical protein